MTNMYLLYFGNKDFEKIYQIVTFIKMVYIAK